MTEDTNLKVSCSPGRHGGTFSLPLGGRLIVPEGFCVKKEYFVCRVVPPSHRWQHIGAFSGEQLTSEIFIFGGNVGMKQRSVILMLPYIVPTDKNLEINVKGLWKDETSWTDVGFIQREDTTDPCVELAVDRFGTFAVTVRSKSDVFQMTAQGGLYHSRLNRNVSIRLPKKAVDTTINYTLQIEPIPEEKVHFCREHFEIECHDLEVVSEVFNFNPDVFCTFKRVATIKLPLPDGVEVEGDQSEEIVVLHKEGERERWVWVETKYKYTRNTVTFDIANPSRLVVVKTAKPSRHRKMQEAMVLLEGRLGTEVGEVTVFLSLRPKSWLAVVEAYPLAQARAVLEQREREGFVAVSRERSPLLPQPCAPQAYSRRASLAAHAKPAVNLADSFELRDGLTWRISVTGDLMAALHSGMADNNELTVFTRLKENYRRFTMEPVANEERPLQASIVLSPKSDKPLDAAAVGALSLTFHLDIPYEAVRAFWFVPEPEPEPEPKKLKKPTLEDLDVRLPAPVPKPVPQPRKTFSVSALERLTQPIKKSQIPDKEAKAISGKSLSALSKVVSGGLTLAVHLGLPDSTITGIGFDALSNGRDMAEVGYRILLYWKRLQRDKRDGAVQQLMKALRSMGKHGVADVVQERHRLNKELSVDCFLAAAVSGIDIS